MDDSISLFANFDSANMARYERVWKSSSQNSTNSTTNTQSSNSNKLNGENNETPETKPNLPSFKYDVEFNVWTKPDCDDTEVGPNPNRTWFYFGIKGGHGRYIKFNLMNLNKQGRLFEMGMLPVFKTIPGHEKWSRIYTRPTWQNMENNFQMSFIHRIPDKRETVTYFAFCFPHSYEDCQQMLEKYDLKFQHCRYLSPDRMDPDDIYYHRELLCYSLDQRRVDLITVSACNMISLKREPRFDPDYLFPRQHASTNTKADDPNFPYDENSADKRCYSFEKKKVFVLTSRVHPGETPASFVFNGFFEFILRKDDPRARVLRRQFVFKLIPLLNPDGVARGYYRTDQLGCNLNRVYLDPCFKYHPSIYAVKSLIVYHHINNRISKEHDGLNFDHIFKLEYDDDPILNENESNENKTKTDSEELNRNSGTYTSATSSSFSPVQDQNLDDVNFHKSSKVKLTRASKTQSSEKLIDNSPEMNASKKTVICNNNLVVENDKNKYQMYSHVTKADTIGESFSRNKALAERISNEWMNCELISQSREEFFKSNSKTHLQTTNASPGESFFSSNKTKTTKSEEDTSQLDYDTNSNNSSNKKSSDESDDLRIGNENSDDDDPSQPDYNLYTGCKNSPHLNDSKLALINPLWSGVAFYIDLHGHAAKRGCFIYGNSIDNELYQVENVLFAKLISISSQHFDFDGCNFSIKNMYMRDKREGLSKEGSGRVAMYKTLGLIHSYTLECCYASGRVMNTIVPAINTAISRSSVISPPLHSDIPPKFMPEHYADVGKALAIAALDIIEMNPNTRIPNTSFGSLEAIRNWLKFYIRSKAERGNTAMNSNLSLMQMPVNSGQSNMTSLKQKNQRFYFQQKLNKLIVNPSKSSTNTLNSVASSSNTDNSINNSNANLAKSQDNQQVQQQQSQQIGTSKSSTNLSGLNKINSNLKSNKKSLNAQGDINESNDNNTKTKSKGLPHSTSQGNLLSNDNSQTNKSSTKMPDNTQTPVKTSSIGLVDFSSNILNNTAQLGNSQFSSTRNKVRHSIKVIKDLENAGNNSKRINSNNSPTNVSSGSSSSTQKLTNDSLAAQLRRKLSIPAVNNKTEPTQLKIADIDNFLENDYFLNGSLNKITSKEKRWFLTKRSEENTSSQLDSATPVNDELTYQTPEDISAKLNNLSKINTNTNKHLLQLNKSNTKTSNDLNSNVILFNQLNTNILVKSNSKKVIPINLTNTTSIVSSLKPEVLYKSLEATSTQQKRYFNAIKPKSGNSSTIDLSDLGYKGSVEETKNLIDFSDIINSANLEIDFASVTSLSGVKKSTCLKENLSKKSIITNTFRKKYLKSNELITIKDRKKK